MRTDHLATFVAVVDHGSISEAARRLHYSQSTVSGHAQSLERALGVLLLMRTRDGVTLTGQGARMYGYARSICLLVVDARDAVNDDGATVRVIALGCADGDPDGDIGNADGHTIARNGCATDRIEQHRFRSLEVRSETEGKFA